MVDEAAVNAEEITNAIESVAAFFGEVTELLSKHTCAENMDACKKVIRKVAVAVGEFTQNIASSKDQKKETDDCCFDLYGGWNLHYSPHGATRRCR